MLFLQKRLDYSRKNRDEILQTIGKIWRLDVWSQIYDDLQWKLLFGGIIGGLIYCFTALKDDINDHLEFYKKKIINTFEEAWEIDRRYSLKCEQLNAQGLELCDYLDMLTEIATPERLPEILTNDVFLQTLDNGDVAFGIPTVITSAIPEISDQELISRASSLSADEFRNSLNNSYDVIAEMGVGTMALIAIFNCKDIFKDELLARHAVTVEPYVSQAILNGSDGFDSVASIAAELGLPEEDVIYLIKNNKLPHNFGADTVPSPNVSGNVADDARIIREYKAILQRNLEKAMQDEGMKLELLRLTGLSEDTLDAMRSGEFSSYTYSLYRTEIASSMKTICDQMSYKVYPKEIKTVVGIVKDAYSLDASGEKGKALKDLLKDDGLSDDKKVASYLKKYGGFSSVHARDIDSFRKSVSAMETLKKVDKNMGTAQKVADHLTTWLSDYEGQVEELNRLIEVGGGNPEYQQALIDLRDMYSNRAKVVLNDVMNTMIDKGIDKAIDSLGPMKVIDTAVELVGKYSGASGYADAAQKAIALEGISRDAVGTYEKALAELKSGNTSDAALQNVRTSFAFAQQTIGDYYDAQVEYYKGFAGTNQNLQMSAYMEHEANRIKNLKLGDSFEAMSYSDYVAKYG